MLMQITARRFTALSPRKDLFEVSKATSNSNNGWCWKPFSSAISSDPSPQRRRRLTKQERKAMVLAFVEKYMVSNAGKFPTASCIYKQVGGSYYVVREIAQELECNRKRDFPETRTVFMSGKVENAKLQYSSLTDKRQIIAGVKQKSFKERAAHASEVATSSCQKVAKGFERSSISSNLFLGPQVDVDLLRRAISEGLEDNNMGFDNVSAPTSTSAGATIKQQVHKSLEIADAGEGKFGVSAKLKTQTTDLPNPAKERGEVREDGGATRNSQNTYASTPKMMSNEEVSSSENLNHFERPMIDQNASSTQGLDFWGNLKSMAFGIINLWKK